MKVFCIAALSADGFIAKNAEDTLEWRSLEDKRFFREKTMEAGVVVMGKNTYESIGKSLKGRLNLVYSLEPIEGVETTQKEPRELLSELEKRGYEQVAVIGGSSVYTQFLQARVVDTLYLTYEPVLLGKGIKLLNEGMELRLKLVSQQKLGEGRMLLEYNVNE